MDQQLLARIRCPKTGQRLHTLTRAAGEGVATSEDWLVSEDGIHSYPVRGGIPRFVPTVNYADNFGMQWNRFRKTQLDCYSGHQISAGRFWSATGWEPSSMKGKWVLDVGCGAGRFAEVALRAGASVVALDYSTAVDACYANLASEPNLHVVQGDIYSLPFEKGSFDFVYSLGVLQHTPDVRAAFAALPHMLRPGGLLCVDYYWRRFRTMMHAKYVFRPIAKLVSQKTLFSFLEHAVPSMLRLSSALASIPLAGIALKRLIPVADYRGIYPLSAEQHVEWALLDTFDMLAPTFDNPQTLATAAKWLIDAGLDETEVFHEGHLVARGRRPYCG